MSLYDLVLGDGRQQERAVVLLAVLGNPDPGRIRDAWVELRDGEPVIVLYTRNGGGSRECSCDDKSHPDGPCAAVAAGTILPGHPLYMRDADDTCDSAYAAFYFRCPRKYRDELLGVARAPVDTSARWEEAVARIQAGDLRPSEVALADQVAAFARDPDAAGPTIMEI
ncbi:MAG TPA: hypothetical protein VK586_08465 [Streptosporangiaceae bacterium]|nr:hypothetical protein [Streptosporangiaceae bacterium]